MPGDHCHLSEYKFALGKYVKGLNTLTDGLHNKNYTFELTVTNRAGLFNTQKLTVQIDTTPPITGAVNDSALGEPDIDYQQSATLQASFSGFSDPDSGIRAYMYHFGAECLAPANGVDRLNMTQFTRSIKQTVSWKAPGPGRYVVTALAMNNAWEPSRVVCSDGITVDVHPAVITQVNISNVYARPGIVWGSIEGDHMDRHLGKQKEPNNFWILHSNMTRQRVTDYPADCKDKATSAMSEPGGLGAFYRLNETYDKSSHTYSYPTYNASATATYASDEHIGDPCALPAGTPDLYLASAKLLVLHWATDSPVDAIAEFYVGLGKKGVTTKQANPATDLRAYARSNRRYDLSIVHPPVENGQEFFILIKVVKRNKAVRVSSFGPVHVDTTPPLKGVITIIDRSISGNIVVRWKGLTDPEESTSTGVVTPAGPFFSVGFSSAGVFNSSHGRPDDLLHFRPATDSANVCKNKPGCTSFAGRDAVNLGPHRVVIRACTSSQQCTHVFSNIQSGVPHSTPVGGVVYDQDPVHTAASLSLDNIQDAFTAWTTKRATAKAVYSQGDASSKVLVAAKADIDAAAKQFKVLMLMAVEYTTVPNRAVRGKAAKLTKALAAALALKKPPSLVYTVPSTAPTLKFDCTDNVDFQCQNRGDVDFQTSMTRIASRWSGFGKGEVVRYDMGVGTQPNMEKPDVAAFTPVTGTSHVLTASLTAGVKYYSTIRANNVVGYSLVSSDGVVPAPLGAYPLSVQDGPGCDNAAVIFNQEAPTLITLRPATSSTSTSTSSSTSTFTTTTVTTSTATTVAPPKGTLHFAAMMQDMDEFPEGGGGVQPFQTGPVKVQTAGKLGAAGTGKNWMLSCATAEKFAGARPLDTTQKVVMQIKIGNVTDYFRPKKNRTFCNMLASSDGHEWSPKYVGTNTKWYTLHASAHTGGGDYPGSASKGVPFKDPRRTATIWAYIKNQVGPHSCCRNTYTNITNGSLWGWGFDMYIHKPNVSSTTKAATATTGNNNTNATATTTASTITTTTTTATTTTLWRKDCTVFSNADTCTHASRPCRWIETAEYEHPPGTRKPVALCLPAMQDEVSLPGQHIVQLHGLHPGAIYHVRMQTRLHDISPDKETHAVHVRVGSYAGTVVMQPCSKPTTAACGLVTTEFEFVATAPDNGISISIRMGEQWGHDAGDTKGDDNWQDELAETMIESLQVKRCVQESAYFPPGEPFSARWSLSKATDNPATHFEWSIVRRNESCSKTGSKFTCAADAAFVVTQPFQSVGSRSSVTDNSVVLQSGFHKVAIRPCVPSGCYDTVYSNGFSVAPGRPAALATTATYAQPGKHDGSTTLDLNWADFRHGLVPMAAYQWTLATSEKGHGIFLPWSTIIRVGPKDVGVSWKEGKVHVIKTLARVDLALRDFEVPIFFILRAIGEDGMANVVGVRAKATTMLARANMVPILDIKVTKTTAIEEADPVDSQYTNSRHILAAAWPNLWSEFSPDWYVWSLSTTPQFVLACNAEAHKDANFTVEGTGNAQEAAALACGYGPFLFERCSTAFFVRATYM